MSDTMTREDRRSALDEFAEAVRPANESLGELAIVSPLPVPQVITARRVDVVRDERRILDRIKALAAAAGDRWYYRWEAKDNRRGGVNWVEGLTITGANAVLFEYGNCEVSVDFADIGSHYMFRARLVDYERGVALTRLFQQRKSQKTFKTDAERQADIVFQIGQSKAIRNVITDGLQTFCDYALEEAKHSLVDKIGKNIEAWRERAIERVSAHVDVKRVEAVLGRKAKDWLAPDIARVIERMKAVAEGMATLDETFPPLQPEQPASVEQLDQFAGSTQPASPPSSEAGGGSGGGPVHAPETTSADAPAGAAQRPQTTAPAAGLEHYREAIDKLLEIATSKKLPELKDRVELIDGARQLWIDRGLDETFVDDLVGVAKKVAKGDMRENGARSFCEGRVKEVVR